LEKAIKMRWRKLYVLLLNNEWHYVFNPSQIEQMNKEQMNDEVNRNQKFPRLLRSGPIISQEIIRDG